MFRPFRIRSEKQSLMLPGKRNLLFLCFPGPVDLSTHVQRHCDFPIPAKYRKNEETEKKKTTRKTNKKAAAQTDAEETPKKKTTRRTTKKSDEAAGEETPKKRAARKTAKKTETEEV